MHIFGLCPALQGHTNSVKAGIYKQRAIWGTLGKKQGSPWPGLHVLCFCLFVCFRLPCIGHFRKHPDNAVNQSSVQITAYSPARYRAWGFMNLCGHPFLIRKMGLIRPKVASLQDVPKESHLLVDTPCALLSHILPFYQSGLLWPIAHSRSNGTSLLRLNHKRLRHPSWAFLSRSIRGKPRWEQPCRDDHVSLSEPGSRTSSPSQTFGSSRPSQQLDCKLMDHWAKPLRFLILKTVWDNKWGYLYIYIYIYNDSYFFPL